VHRKYNICIENLKNIGKNKIKVIPLDKKNIRSRYNID
jgi:hypothetical protein